MKKTISLGAMDPIEIYGAGNKIIEEFCSYFPTVKAVVRGSEIAIEGKSSDLEEFTQKFAELVDRRHHKMNLTVYDVEELFSGVTPSENLRTGAQSVIVYNTEGKAIRARNAKQQEMVRAYFDNDLIFALGPAGTGKTYIAIALAVRALKNREIRRIILTRPAVEAGERLGFLPGDLKDKLDPYLQPLYDALEDMIPQAKLKEYMETGVIQIAPLAFMRGRTLSEAVIILDEAQNTTTHQIKMFLTRLGMNAKMVITGDVTQIDLPHTVTSGLVQALRVLRNVSGVGRVQFEKKDIVRHPLVQRIVEAYEKHDEEQKALRQEQKERRIENNRQ